ncbi:thrombin-like enzyme collinein-1 isoform X2 [Drosophila obscura]|uniref:thrombin-like enzyme collinein-1 isoform X2 n=1 Tax=Drosophila obscura TaxID=7282 RepID=UPI001BB11929|nr:thrombin-like enzyme collinein-1 isoform X2 [Drosophila obscura]
MEIRNLSGCVLLLLLFLPPPSTDSSSSASNADHPLSRLPRRRIKRISTPYYEEKKTLDMAKYVVSLRSRTPRKYFGDNHYCGGVIISRTFILTAAHCTMDRKILHRARVLLVVAGTPNRLKFWRGRTVNAPVKDVYVPENFTMFNTNNIALLKLAIELPDNPYIAIASLPTHEPVYNINYTLLGWGRVYKGGPLASSILHVDVKLLDHQTCEELVQTFKDEMMCAGNLEDDQDENPCAGDTGSPLLLNGTVYGIVSYRIGCGSKSLPSVYTNVFAHLEWIDEIMTSGESVRRGCTPSMWLAATFALLNVPRIKF